MLGATNIAVFESAFEWWSLWKTGGLNLECELMKTKNKSNVCHRQFQFVRRSFLYRRGQYEIDLSLFLPSTEWTTVRDG